jgi:hypothetical protein
MIALSEHQLAAYAEAIYEVEVDGAWIDARAYVAVAGDRAATLISACNPWSQLLSDAENARRHACLREQIATGGHRWTNARGRSADFRWIEPGFLVQAPDDQVDAWARQWQQHAVLVLRGPAQVPALRLYSPFAGDIRPQQLANLRLEWVGCVPPAPP